MAASAKIGSSRRCTATPARFVPTSHGAPIARTFAVRRSATAASTRWSSAPTRSILLMNTTVGTPSRRRARNSSNVCDCTPSTAETTRTAPSRTPSTRSTSAMKSGCPGVSMRLIVTPSTTKDTTADLIVIPRWRSRASESVCVVPSSTRPMSSMTPAACSSRSVRVVLPASTCARIPKFNVANSRHVLQIGIKSLIDEHRRLAHHGPPR